MKEVLLGKMGDTGVENAQYGLLCFVVSGNKKCSKIIDTYHKVYI